MTVRLIVHVFEGTPYTVPRIEVWEIDWDPKGETPNPVLLRADKPMGSDLYLFSLERMEGDTAIYHPYATSPKLSLLEDLPKFGYRKVEQS
jgi:hypothetical protein